MSPIGTTRQFNGVVSNDAFGAYPAERVSRAERPLWVRQRPLDGHETDEGFFRVAEAAIGLAREAMPADGTGNPRVLIRHPWLGV
jgi:hypothetical protein